MDNLKDISIIVPCHNLELYIRPLICSLNALNLTNINTEIIFVLDACEDDTMGVINRYANGFPYKIIECDHHSCGFARNEGLNIAQGEFIWFIDGDDWIIYPDVLQKTLPVMREKQLDIIQLKFVSNLFNIEYFSMVWQYIYRKDAIGDLRFEHIQPNEDVKFNRAFFQKYGLTQIEKFEVPTYFYYYKRPGSNISIYNKTGKIRP